MIWLAQKSFDKTHSHLAREGSKGREAVIRERFSQPRTIANGIADLLLPTLLQGLVSQFLQVHKLFPPVEGIFGEQQIFQGLVDIPLPNVSNVHRTLPM